MLFFRISNWSQSVQSTDDQSDIKNLFSFLQFIPSSWQETKMFTRQIKVQIGKSTLGNNYKGKMPTLTGKKQLSVHFFLYRPRLFHLLAEIVRV